MNNLDFNNIISFVGSDENSTIHLLYKIKLTVNLLFYNEAFNDLIRYSLTNNEFGKKLILGNSILHNFLITSIISNNDEEESYVIVMKYIKKTTHDQFKPGMINAITLKKFRINDLYWKNESEIAFNNTTGNEYIVKISFFNRN